MSKILFFIKRSVLAVLVLLFFSVSGCSGDGYENAEGNGAEFERIICMSPATAEIVFALNQGDRVVGVSDYTSYPPQVMDLPRCGGFLNPNFEIMLSLGPDLIITQGAAADLVSFGERYGIDVISLEISDLDSIFAAIVKTGEVLGCEPEAQSLAETMTGRLDSLERAWPASETEKTDVLIVVGRAPDSLRELYVAGSGGFLEDLVDLSGGDNIMSDIPRQYSGVSKEIIAERSPEVIIEFFGDGVLGEKERKQYLSAWEDMGMLPAVRNERVYVIDGSYAMIPGPRLVKTAEKIAKILNPD